MEDDKLKQYFGEMVVYKDLKKNNFFSSLSLPSFLRDWMLKEFQHEDGTFDVEDVMDFINTYLPRENEWVSIKGRLMEGENVKLLTKINVDVDLKYNTYNFSLPLFSLSNRDTVIEPYVWDQYKEKLLGGEHWGIVELGYNYSSEKKNMGKIALVSYTDFCPYDVDLDYFKDARSKFTIREWIDIILGAIDYNADGYESDTQKMTVLYRLMPFVEKRLNMIELAPKGTGKSYIFGNISRHGWLSSGGVMSRAKMFYDVARRSPGLVSSHDFVALDEVQTIKFTDVSEMRGALKTYMEEGKFTVLNYEGVADAGIVLLGNINKDLMDVNENMFSELPESFHESALMDRFHAFIKGWDIPRMHDDLKACGWCMNSEYFCSIMHLLRDDPSYRAIVDEIVEVPSHSDTRDTEAVKRVSTALLKLLFPNVRKASDVDVDQFEIYCLEPAIDMRRIIDTQLAILDPKEFKDRRPIQLSVRCPDWD